MKYLVRAAWFVLSVATIPPVANAATFGLQHSQTMQHQGAYDDTGHGPSETGMEGGGG